MVKFKKGYFYKTNIKKNNFMLFFCGHLMSSVILKKIINIL